MVKDIKLGSIQVQKAYVGDSLVFEYIPPDITAPITAIRPDPTLTYDSAQTVWLDVNEPADTYYTTDGSTPTTASTKYVGGGIPISATTTFKYFSVDRFGNTESVQTTTYNIQTVKSYRYVRFQGFGDQTSVATTRLVEFDAMHGTTDRLAGLVPISGETVNAGGTINRATDGDISMASGSYPIWWSGAGIPTLTYDLGNWYAIDTLKVWMYSTTNDPRQTKFKLFVSTDNVTWELIADWSNNTGVQPATGWAFDVATKSVK